MISNPRTATFLCTDLENSTPLWENYPDLMQELSARHDALIREAIETHRGRVVKTMGDGFLAVFETATEGVVAMLAGQQALIGEAWPAETGPLNVRMGLHTGASRERDGDYYGPELNRAARVMGIASGGQVLIPKSCTKG
jgi:class 3 adenylate cyclase